MARARNDIKWTAKRKTSPKLFRVILPVNNVDEAASFYENLLSMKGKRVSSGRHYFDCNGTILACFDPRADGDDFDLKPNPDHLYFSVNDLELVFDRAVLIGAKILSPIGKRPWGERSFYMEDPFGNKICFVDDKTLFLG
ncbi:putative enzyme related to lactoylglutathione lyase [Thermoplasmatales archaeon]|nr:putative enzyme related to lactoylglutathione lyase [Thermoplasmatales archaeon]